MKNNSFKTIILLLSFLFIAISLQQCASVGNPAGGPKDKTPPKVIKSTPAAYSVNYLGSKVEIEFDEYIQLKEIQQKFLVSPPMVKQPKVEMKGKSIFIKSEEAFKTNTTYSLKFFNTISDNNEGNILNDYEFVFATGPKIDTLRLFGTVKDAFELKPIENMLVMVYTDLSDSIPYKSIPDYLTISDKNGRFSINNIASGKYKIFALADGNMNKKFDMPDEVIAFSTIFLEPKADWKSKTDTLRVDSVLKGDVYEYRDTIITKNKLVYTPDSVKLKSFVQKSDYQYIESVKRTEKGKLTFAFRQGLGKDDKLIPQNFTKNSKTVLEEFSIEKDTITWWLTDSIAYNVDTLKLHFNYQTYDSLGLKKPATDTLLLSFDKNAKKEVVNRKNDAPIKSELTVYFEVGNANMMDMNKVPTISFARPVTILDITRFSLTQLKDTTVTIIPFTLDPTDKSNRKYTVNAKFTEGLKYKLIVDSLAVRDIYENINDSTGANFSVLPKTFYGTLVLDLKNIKNPTIIQLLNKSGAMVMQKTITESGKNTLTEVYPGEYSLKAIIDSNKNNKWDTGDYLKKKQPETTKVMKGKVLMRSNWDTNIEWDLNK